MNYRKSRSLLLLTITLLISSCAQPAGTAAPVPQTDPTGTAGADTGTSAALKGITSETVNDVQARPSLESDYIPAEDGMTIVKGGGVRTGEESRVRLDLSSGTFLRVGPLSQFTLEANEPSGDGWFTHLKLELGKVWIILKGGSLEVETPSGLAGVAGSYMSVEQRADGTMIVTCLEGDCFLVNNAGRVELAAGQAATIVDSATPPEVRVMTDEEVSEWLAVNPEARIILPALTATQRALATATYTPSPTATVTATATVAYSTLTGIVQADSLSCRYGPGAPYLYYYGLYKGNQVEVLGRNDAATWIYVQYGDTLHPCWVNARFVEMSGDVLSLEPVYPLKAPLILFSHPNFPPVKNVEASRSGNTVTIFWLGYELALGDRESAESPLYLLELWTCQGGQIVFTPLGVFDQVAEIIDEPGCAEPSHGQVFIAHKDGYVGPAIIPWPAP